MKPTIEHGPCPSCGVDTWLVRGPQGEHWLCTGSRERAVAYAAERFAATEQPGTGDQVQQKKEVTK